MVTKRSRDLGEYFRNLYPAGGQSRQDAADKRGAAADRRAPPQSVYRDPERLHPTYLKRYAAEWILRTVDDHEGQARTGKAAAGADQDSLANLQEQNPHRREAED